jgi:hypothetical protein
MTKRVGRVTHERRYVIIPVPDSWRPGDQLPPPSQEDQWFDSFLTFISVLNKPYDRTPIERQPWNVATADDADGWTALDPQVKLS